MVSAPTAGKRTTATKTKTTTTATATKKRTPAATSPVSKKAPKTVTPAEGAAPLPKAKNKLVRDSFTIPKAEYLILDRLKERAANLKRPTKKSEVLRAGISLLHSLGDAAFLAALRQVPSLKTGRPKSQA